VTSLPVGSPLRFVIQKHLAERAGPHFDMRMGPDQGNKPTLLSWALRKLPEMPGEKRMAFQQPLHTGAYANFKGKIVSGYGKGTVETHDNGSVLVTKVEPDKINFVVIHKKHPETFTLVRTSGQPAQPRTAREARTQGGSWLMINTTPTDVIKHQKVHYAKVPAEDVAKLFDEKYLHEEKIDGAAALYKLFSDKVEVLSYRPTTAGRPIVHSYRVGGTTGLNIPKHLVGSILRGELYGVKRSTGHAIPSQELGGLLNSATLRSLETQKERGIELRNRVFNILQYGKASVGDDVPYPERVDKLKEILQYLPDPKFTLPEMAGTPETQRDLWERITTGKHPLTREGIVAWPKAGGKPTKVKLYDESDVFVREIFPGGGRLKGSGAGGFKYSLEPEGPIVGEVGTGFSEETRRQMLEAPNEYVGRVARIKSQEQFPSGAHRAPSFLSLHEDYPAAKAASLVKRATWMPQGYNPQLLAAQEAHAAAPSTLGGVAGDVGMTAAFSPLLSTASTVGKHAIGRGGAGTLVSSLGKVWSPKTVLAEMGKYFLGSPAAAQGAAGAARAARVAGTVGNVARGAAGVARVGSGAFLPWNVGIDSAKHLIGAYTNPEYQAGRIGYLRSVGQDVDAGATAQQAATQEALRKSLLTGTATSALSGIMNPVSTVAGLGQSLWRLAKSPFSSKSSSPKVLAPIIKIAIAELGGAGETLNDLVKAAEGFVQKPPQLSPELAQELGIKPKVSVQKSPQLYPVQKQPQLSPELAQELGIKPKVSFGDRLRALVTGIKPEELQNMRTGAQTISGLVERARAMGLF